MTASLTRDDARGEVTLTVTRPSGRPVAITFSGEESMRRFCERNGIKVAQ